MSVSKIKRDESWLKAIFFVRPGDGATGSVKVATVASVDGEINLTTESSVQISIVLSSGLIAILVKPSTVTQLFMIPVSRVEYSLLGAIRVRTK